MRYLLTFLLLLTVQSPAEPTLAAANARLQAQDPAGAARMLETITAREPANARAWRLLGVAYQRGKRLDEAFAAYRKALDLDPSAPQVLYNLGTAYAVKGDVNAAFDWLGRAKATRQLDMTQIDTDAELATLKTDPRFQAFAAGAGRLCAAVRRVREGDPRVGRRGGQRSVRLDCARGRRCRSRWHSGHRDIGPDQSDRRRCGGAASISIRRKPARCSGASMAGPAISWGPGSRRRAMPITTACPT